MLLSEFLISSSLYHRGGIYIITCTATNLKYVGSAGEFKPRLRSHLRDLQQGKHTNLAMQDDFKKYGEQSFAIHFVKIVSWNYPRQQLYADEQLYLDTIKTFDGYYNKSFKCKAIEKVNSLPDKVKEFVRKHIDPYLCARMTFDTFDNTTVVSYAFQDMMMRYHTIKH